MSRRKEIKKESILNAATQLFLDKGYKTTKIIDIANAAGIGKGTVYEYFVSKESILLELIDTRTKKEYLRFLEIMNQDISCRQKLERFLALHIEIASQNHMCVTDFKKEFFREIGGIADEIIESIHEVVFFHADCVYKVITEGIKRGEFRNVDPYAATSCFVGSVGFYISMLQHGFPASKHEKFEQKNFANKDSSVIDFIFRGLLA